MKGTTFTVISTLICATLVLAYPTYKIMDYSTAPFTAYITDVNEDGGNDIVVLAKKTSEDTIYWFENLRLPGLPGRFWEEHEVAELGHQYYLNPGDFDDTNYLDVIHSNGAGYLNGGSPDSWNPFTIEAGVNTVGAADINRDGKDDVIYAGSNIGGWYENDGNGSSWTLHADTFENKPVVPVDVDGDHDWDVVTMYQYQFVPSHFYIAENVDGFGGSWNETEINVIAGDNVLASRGVAVLNADGNSTADICIAVKAETAGDVLTLSLNAGASTMSVDEGTAYSTVLGADFDGDGLDEVVAYDFGTKTTYLFEDLTASPAKSEVKTNFKPLAAGDINEDGAADLVGYSYDDTALVWLDLMRTLYPDHVSPEHVPPQSEDEYSFYLSQSSPNPSHGEAVIEFNIPETGNVRLTVYDITGREVSVLESGTLPAGEYSREVSGLPSGVYIYRLAAGPYTAVKKMLVLE